MSPLQLLVSILWVFASLIVLACGIVGATEPDGTKSGVMWGLVGIGLGLLAVFYLLAILPKQLAKRAMKTIADTKY